MRAIKTQTDAIKTALANGESLSALNSFKLTGSLRLGARIFDARKKGWVIKSEKKTTKTRYGTPCYYFEYSLDQKNTPKNLWMQYRK
jgi:hypothetical protein